MLERFHHSTVFYLLLAPDWHIPFQAYIVPPVLLILVLVLQVKYTPLPCASFCTYDCSKHVQTWSLPKAVAA